MAEDELSPRSPPTETCRPQGLARERGQYAYLVLIIQGGETPRLREAMRKRLQEYESRNQGVLRNSHGAPVDLAWTAETLTPWFPPRE